VGHQSIGLRSSLLVETAVGIIAFDFESQPDPAAGLGARLNSVPTRSNRWQEAMRRSQSQRACICQPEGCSLIVGRNSLITELPPLSLNISSMFLQGVVLTAPQSALSANLLSSAPLNSNGEFESKISPFYPVPGDRNSQQETENRGDNHGWHVEQRRCRKLLGHHRRAASSGSTESSLSQAVRGSSPIALGGTNRFILRGSCQRQSPSSRANLK
jgi:hypothetical protein